MRKNPFGWDLPPGVTESMLPGNTGYDDAFDEAVERLDVACYEYVLGEAQSVVDSIEEETGHVVDVKDLVGAFMETLRYFVEKEKP